MNSLNRRRFLGQTATAAIVASLHNSVVYACDPTTWSLVDPILRLPPVPAQDSQSAFSLVESAGRMLSERPDGDFEIEDCFRRSKPDKERDAIVSEWLDKNKRAIAPLDQAIRQGGFRFPADRWTDSRIDAISWYRDLARYLQLAAQRDASRKDFQAAIAGATKLVNFSRMITNGSGVFVEYLVGCACEQASLALVTRFSRDPSIDVADLTRSLAELPYVPDPMKAARAAVQAEFCVYLLPSLTEAKELDTVRQVELFLDWNDRLEMFVPRAKYKSRREKIIALLAGHAKSFDFPDTVKRASAKYASFIRSFELPWTTHKKQSNQIAFGELGPWPSQLSFSILDAGDPNEVTVNQLAMAREKLKDVSNPLGKKIIESCELDSQSMHRAALGNQARYDGTRLSLAIQIFKRKTGKLPVELSQLRTTKTIGEIPVDPFSGESFNYSRAEKELWSVGPDGSSPSNDTAEHDDGLDDWRWRLDSAAF